MEAFEKLEVWRRSAQLAIELHRMLESCRHYGFRDQICRSALSVPSNIAEGYERNSRREYLRFLKIAKGSCGELRTQLHIGIGAGILDDERCAEIYREAVELARMLQAMTLRIESGLRADHMRAEDHL